MQGLFNESVKSELIAPMIIGTVIYFHLNKSFYKDILTIKNNDDYDDYLKNDLTIHLQKTINAILTNET